MFRSYDVLGFACVVFSLCFDTVDYALHCYCTFYIDIIRRINSSMLIFAVFLAMICTLCVWFNKRVVVGCFKKIKKIYLAQYLRPGGGGQFSVSNKTHDRGGGAIFPPRTKLSTRGGGNFSPWTKLTTGGGGIFLFFFFYKNMKENDP